NGKLVRGRSAPLHTSLRNWRPWRLLLGAHLSAQTIGNVGWHLLHADALPRERTLLGISSGRVLGLRHTAFRIRLRRKNLPAKTYARRCRACRIIRHSCSDASTLNGYRRPCSLRLRIAA